MFFFTMIWSDMLKLRMKPATPTEFHMDSQAWAVHCLHSRLDKSISRKMNKRLWYI